MMKTVQSWPPITERSTFSLLLLFVIHVTLPSTQENGVASSYQLVISEIKTIIIYSKYFSVSDRLKSPSKFRLASLYRIWMSDVNRPITEKLLDD